MTLTIACLSALLTLQAPSAGGTAAAPVRPALASVEELLRRPAVLGGSLSDGLGLKADVGARTSLAEIAEQGLLAPHEGWLDQASVRPLVQLDNTARAWVAAARGHKASLVFALDFLWWYGYGQAGSGAERERQFERGLTLLGQLEMPLLVGDLPDLSPALRGRGIDGPMLAAGQVPDAATLAKLNQRLGEWALVHPNVVVVPLGALYARCASAQEIALRGNRWAKEQTAALLQPDRFHPTLDGSILCLIAAWDQLLVAWPEIPATSFEWNAQELRRKLIESKAKARAAEIEREKRRKEAEATPPPPPPEPPSENPEERKPPQRRPG